MEQLWIGIAAGLLIILCTGVPFAVLCLWTMSKYDIHDKRG